MFSEYAIYIRGKDGMLRDRLLNISNLSIVEILNDIGSWTIKSTTPERCPFQIGDGLVVYKNGDYYYSGITKKISEEYDGYSNLYSWTIQGTSDLDFLNHRLCYPDPATGSTTTTAYYTDTGYLSDVVSRLVNRNMGADAMRLRREPLFASVISENVGQTTSVELRFETLLRGIQPILESQNFSISPYWDGNKHKFSFILKRSNDISHMVLFSTELNSVETLSYLANMPDGNFIVSGGQGDLTEKAFTYSENSESEEQWGRIEYFNDMRSVKPEELQEKSDLALKELSEENIGFSAQLTTDGAFLRYRKDWNLGDFVGIVAHNQTYIRRILQVETNLTYDEETVTPTVGTVDRGQFAEIFRKINKLRADMDYLQWVAE